MPWTLPAPSGRTVRSRLLLAPMLALALLTGGCGGGGGGGGPPGPLPPAPTASLVFPAHGGLTAAETLRVRGTADSSVGVASVTVAGVPATSGDGFTSWTAEVPLVLGVNALDVVVTDVTGQQAAGEGTSVERTSWLLSTLADITSDPANDRLYALELDTDAIVRVELGTGQAIPIASPTVGTGVPFQGVDAIEFDLGGDRVLAASQVQGTIFAIDPFTFVRTLVTQTGMAGGPPLPILNALAHDPVQKVIYGGTSAGEIFGVDQDTGDRWLHSGPGVGNGPALGPVRDVEMDVPGGRMLVLVSGGGQIGVFAVSLTTGDRTLLSGQGVGAGPMLVSPTAFVLDPAAGRCIVAQNSFPAAFLSVDLATGERKEFDIDVQPKLTSTYLMAPNAVDGTFFAYDAFALRVRTVALLDGKVSEAWGGVRGSGPLVVDNRGLAALPGGTHAVLLDQYASGALTVVELATGDRASLLGSGPNVSGAMNLVLQESQGRALVTGFAQSAVSVVAVDVATGDRTVLSGGAIGGGPLLSVPRGLALDEAAGRLYVSDDGAQGILAVDLTTGARSLVSDAVTGSGPVPTEWRAVVVDPIGERLLVAATVAGWPALLSVDPDTGDRVLLCDASAPGADMLLPTAELSGDGSTLQGVGFQDTISLDLTTFQRTATAPTLLGTSPRFSTLRCFDLLPGDVALAHDASGPLLYEVDLVTGERVFVTR